MPLVAEDPLGQVWRLLRLLADVPSTTAQIEAEQGTGPEQRKNVRKQAEQIGHCIRQGEEYFTAAQRVSLATRPVLLYYGAVALSRALILMRRDGTFSFDALRKTERHNHHGLILRREQLAQLGPSSSAEEVLENLVCEVHCRHDTGEPWGNFPLFYESLSPTAVRVRVQVVLPGKQSGVVQIATAQTADLLSLSELTAMPLATLVLARSLPDLFLPLLRAGQPVDLARGQLEATSTRVYDEQGAVTSITDLYRFSVDGITGEKKDNLVQAWTSNNPEIKVIDDHGANVLLTLSYIHSDDPEETKWFPDVCEDIGGAKFFLLSPETYLAEPAAHLAMLFSLSMAARYYPDLWMGWTRSVRTAELLSVFLDVVDRKFPQLLLDQLTLTKHYVRQVT